jgi:hypothetical protein
MVKVTKDFNAGGEARTPDLCFTKALLYQLSYTGVTGFI